MNGMAGIESMDRSTPRDNAAPTMTRATREASQFLEQVPGAREAIQRRLENDPEYRRWLQQFGKGVLLAVE